MLLNDAITRLNYRCDELGIPRPDPLHVEALLPTALNQLANECAGDGRLRYVQKEFTSITMTSGVADLSAQTTMILESISRVVHSDSSVGKLSRVPNRSDLDHPRNQLVTWYAQENDKIYGMAGDGSTVPANGTLTVTAAFVPTVLNASSTLHAQLDDDLVEGLVGLLAAEQGATT